MRGVIGFDKFDNKYCVSFIFNIDAWRDGFTIYYMLYHKQKAAKDNSA
ncbi:MAG: hypothetical protein U0K68_07695 [Agathobacter sp.]|nr:hypothetical protein [Agathobacter sp.]